MSNWRDLTSQTMRACVQAMGEEIFYTRAIGGSAVRIFAMVDENFESVNPNTGASIISEQPMIGFKTADLQFEPAKNDRVLVRGKMFRVIEKQWDGQAGTKLLLHKIS